MLCPEIEDKLRVAKLALNEATSENIIGLCQEYLALLDAYRRELYKLPDVLDLNLRASTPSSREDVINNRSAVRAALETTTRERQRAEALLRYFTMLSGHEAVETLNRLRHKGRDDWKQNAGGARYGDGTDEGRMTVQEVVDMAGLLRREEHVARGADERAHQPDGTPQPSRP